MSRPASNPILQRYTDLGIQPGLVWLFAVITLVSTLTAASACLALKDIGAPRPVLIAMMVSLLIAIHAGLPAAIGFAALAFAFWSAVPRLSTADGPWGKTTHDLRPCPLKAAKSDRSNDEKQTRTG